MGRRGPKPEPLAVQEAKGWSGKRKPAHPVTPPPVLPDPPEYLTGLALETWHRVGTQLLSLGLMTELDKDALAGYCQTYADWRKHLAFLQEYGSTYVLRDSNGGPRYFGQHPQVSMARQALRELRAFQAEFGMTPSGRARLDIQLPTLPGDAEEALASEMLGPARR